MDGFETLSEMTGPRPDGTTPGWFCLALDKQTEAVGFNLNGTGDVPSFLDKDSWCSRSFLFSKALEYFAS